MKHLLILALFLALGSAVIGLPALSYETNEQPETDITALLYRLAQQQQQQQAATGTANLMLAKSYD